MRGGQPEDKDKEEEFDDNVETETDEDSSQLLDYRGAKCVVSLFS